MPHYGISHESGTLKRVLVHHPGKELELANSNPVEHHFDGPIDIERFIVEHKRLMRYGVIGCVMAKCANRGITTFIDKDFIAIEFAQKNTKINGIENSVIKLSNGLSKVEKNDFNIIATNLPSNVGKELLTILLSESKKKLVKNGKLYVVTVSGLRKFIQKNLLSIFGNYEKLKQGRNHTVACAVKKK